MKFIYTEDNTAVNLKNIIGFDRYEKEKIIFITAACPEIFWYFKNENDREIALGKIRAIVGNEITCDDKAQCPACIVGDVLNENGSTVKCSKCGALFDKEWL